MFLNSKVHISELHHFYIVPLQICLVMLFIVIVVSFVMCPPLGLLRDWPVFWLIWWKVWPFLIIFSVFHICPNVFHCWLIKQVLLSGVWLWKLLKCLPKLEHTSPLRFCCISVKEALNKWFMIDIVMVK